MRARDTFSFSWRAIRGHKLRSTLTTLGVIIGVGAIITFMVLGGAFSENVLGNFDELYGDQPLLLVQTQTPLDDGFGLIFSMTPIYTEHDIATIEAMEDISFVAPLGQIAVTQTRVGGQQVTGGVSVSATTPAGFTFDTFIDGEAFDMGTNEAVINRQVSDRFDGVEVGDTISYTREGGVVTTVTVRGIIDEDIPNQPPTIYVPVDPHYQQIVETPRGTNERAYPMLVIGADSLETLRSAQDMARAYLHGDSDANALKSDRDTILVQTIDDLVQQITDLLDQITVFIAGIAGIALVVGAIGIANIMIVSVVERTREIGIMKSVGATRRHIIQLFLVESIILGVIGALLGVLLGFGIGALGVMALEWPMVYPLEWVVIATGMGLIVGALAGVYPAWRAASVDPVIALGRE